ncbi:hypothetical protein B0H10DRAFT_2201206 [Mycena sp. CBHHK59/15]|nr:hypothetical protein B0H10DRAFT_2201206 [Mycena sp. CBHHK59/15]
MPSSDKSDVFLSKSYTNSLDFDSTLVGSNSSDSGLTRGQVLKALLFSELFGDYYPPRFDPSPCLNHVDRFYALAGYLRDTPVAEWMLPRDLSELEDKGVGTTTPKGGSAGPSTVESDHVASTSTIHGAYARKAAEIDLSPHRVHMPKRQRHQEQTKKVIEKIRQLMEDPDRTETDTDSERTETDSETDTATDPDKTDPDTD